MVSPVEEKTKMNPLSLRDLKRITAGPAMFSDYVAQTVAEYNLGYVGKRKQFAETHGMTSGTLDSLIREAKNQGLSVRSRKVTEEEREEISELSNYASTKEIASAYGISSSYARKIIREERITADFVESFEGENEDTFKPDMAERNIRRTSGFLGSFIDGGKRAVAYTTLAAAMLFGSFGNYSIVPSASAVEPSEIELRAEDPVPQGSRGPSFREYFFGKRNTNQTAKVQSVPEKEYEYFDQWTPRGVVKMRREIKEGKLRPSNPREYKNEKPGQPGWIIMPPSSKAEPVATTKIETARAKQTETAAYSTNIATALNGSSTSRVAQATTKYSETPRTNDAPIIFNQYVDTIQIPREQALPVNPPKEKSLEKRVEKKTPKAPAPNNTIVFSDGSSATIAKDGKVTPALKNEGKYHGTNFTVQVNLNKDGKVVTTTNQNRKVEAPKKINRELEAKVDSELKLWNQREFTAVMDGQEVYSHTSYQRPGETNWATLRDARNIINSPNYVSVTNLLPTIKSGVDTNAPGQKSPAVIKEDKSSSLENKNSSPEVVPNKTQPKYTVPAFNGEIKTADRSPQKIISEPQSAPKVKLDSRIPAPASATPTRFREPTSQDMSETNSTNKPLSLVQLLDGSDRNSWKWDQENRRFWKSFNLFGETYWFSPVNGAKRTTKEMELETGRYASEYQQRLGEQASELLESIGRNVEKVDPAIRNGFLNAIVWADKLGISRTTVNYILIDDLEQRSKALTAVVSAGSKKDPNFAEKVWDLMRKLRDGAVIDSLQHEDLMRLQIFDPVKATL